MDNEELNWESTEGANLIEILLAFEVYLKEKRDQYPEGSMIWKQHEECLKSNNFLLGKKDE
jgi:hypothetical protein